MRGLRPSQKWQSQCQKDRQRGKKAAKTRTRLRQLAIDWKSLCLRNTFSANDWEIIFLHFSLLIFSAHPISGQRPILSLRLACRNESVFKPSPALERRFILFECSCGTPMSPRRLPSRVSQWLGELLTDFDSAARFRTIASLVVRHLKTQQSTGVCNGTSHRGSAA